MNKSHEVLATYKPASKQTVPPTLSRRDEFAIRLAQGELAGTAPGEEWGSEEQRAKWVVKATDALIAELDKEEQNDGQE